MPGNIIVLEYSAVKRTKSHFSETYILKRDKENKKENNIISYGGKWQK